MKELLFRGFELIQWINVDVEKGHLDLRVIYVKIYLLVRAYIMIGSHTFISLVEIYFNCFECRNNLLEHTGLNQQVFVAVSRFHRDLFPGIRVA